MGNHHYLVNKKMIDFYLALKNGSYVYQISKGDYATISHLKEITDILEKKGLIRTEKMFNGKRTRTRKIYLTDKGLQIQTELFRLRENLRW